jgi:4-diphosphocytidyl-2-C-methyl-D-erythritol kinase
MVVYPNCKINIGLRVLRKRPDGYHDLDSIFYPVPLCDVLEIVPADALQFTLTGITLPEGGTNSCISAWELLNREFGIAPVSIHLHKIIPSGAGLGGGSSDAAFALKALNALFELNLSDNQLEDLSLHIGSDCAFFIRNCPMHVQGRGEVLQPLAFDPIRGHYLAVLNPGIHVPTALAYRLIHPTERDEHTDAIWQHPERWRNEMINDFEAPVEAQHPVIGEIKQWMYSAGAWYSAMSGSGSTVYGIFENEPKLEMHRWPDSFLWVGRL